MISKWEIIKDEALSLRKRGFSITLIEKQLGIPRSTLSGWFKGIILSAKYAKILQDNKLTSLTKNRSLAVTWHNKQKENRLLEAQNNANTILDSIDFNNNTYIKIFLAALYMGEGSKKKPETSMGNSDPYILRFYIKSLIKLYIVKRENIKFELHLRADQNGEEMKKYWAKELDLLAKNCTSISYDKRTFGQKTYETYKGVCLIRSGAPVAIQRELVYLSRGFIEKFLKYGSQ